MNILPFLKNISLDDWYLKATDKWLVKDVVSHLIGWEREVSECLLDAWEKGTEPWFMKINDYTECNQKFYDEFKNYKPEELVEELERWTKDLDKKIAKIGKDNLEKRKKEFDWVLDDGDNSHFLHHLNQIKKAIENDNKSK